MHSLHIRPTGIQHTTCTTNRQHHTSHDHQPKKMLGQTLESQTHIQQTQNHVGQYRYSKNSHQQHGEKKRKRYS